MKEGVSMKKITVGDVMDILIYDYNDYFSIYDVDNDEEFFPDDYTVGKWLRDGKPHDNVEIDEVQVRPLVDSRYMNISFAIM